MKRVPACAIETMIMSLSPSTLKQYDTTFKLWWDYCNGAGVSFFEAGPEEVMVFLQDIFNKGNQQYGTFNSHRSALALVLRADLKEDERLKRFLKGIAVLRPPRPRYNNTWDTQPLLQYLSTLFPYNSITNKLLSLKLASLLVLITGQRIQTISLIKVDNIKETPDGFQIFITDRIKTSGINKTQPCLQIPFYEDNPRLCVASLLKEYMRRTIDHRTANIQQLFITLKPPFTHASKNTISRWVKETLKLAGIDTNKFKPHSTRHASNSMAFRRGLSLDIICKTAGWSENGTTFARFYNRPVVDPQIFARTILQGT